MHETWTTLRVLDWTTGRFDKAGIESPRLEAQILLAHTLTCDRVALYTSFEKPLAADELAAYRGLIKRRLAGEPVAYLVGEQEFWSLAFTVDARVLIPRRDTETLIELVLDRTSDRSAELRIVDIATGSGAIAVTLATELPRAQLVATDCSEAALEIARVNAERHGVADRIEFRLGDLLEPVNGRTFDVLVSNPPYIASAELAKLASDVRHEPRLALDGGADGLDLIRRLISGAGKVVDVGGLVAFEHGFDQGEEVRSIASDAGFRATTHKDLAGNDRVTWWGCPSASEQQNL